MFTAVGGEVTAHSHVHFQFRFGNRWALSLKSHQKEAYFFRARSFIAKHGVLLVLSTGQGQGHVTKGHYIQTSQLSHVQYVLWAILDVKFDGYVSLTVWGNF